MSDDLIEHADYLLIDLVTGERVNQDMEIRLVESIVRAKRGKILLKNLRQEVI